MSLSSSVDRRFYSLTYQGLVPLEFHLSPAELTSLDQPPPLFLSAPRILYLPMLHPQIRSHFLPSTAAVEDELWFEFDGQPLRWQLPIGVLFDLLAITNTANTHHDTQQHDNNYHLYSSTHAPVHSSAHSPSASSSSSSSSPVSSFPRGRPMSITVHFQRFPSKRLTRCKNLFTVRQYYFNSLKEASTMKFSTVKPLIGGAAQDHSKLWDSLVQLKEDIFLSTLQKMFHTVTVHPLFHEDQRALAIRFLFKGFQDPSQSVDQQNEEEFLQVPVQRPIEAKRTAGTGTGAGDGDVTLVQAIASLFPHLIAEPNPSPSPANSSPALLPGLTVLIHGVEPPLDTPIGWLAQYFTHPDLFLYIIIVKMR